MLYVTFVNKSDLADISDYEIRVFVNQREIAGPFKVRGHRRADGWLKLVEQFVREQKREGSGIALNIDVSNTCVCGHGMGKHPVTAPAHGKCVSYRCKCKAFHFGNAPTKNPRSR